MKQRTKKILGGMMSSAMMFSMLSSLGMVSKASEKTYSVLFEITPKQYMFDYGYSLDFFEVKSVKNHDDLVVKDYDVKKAYAGPLLDSDRPDRYPLEVTVELKMKPGSTDTIGKITRVDVDDVLQYCDYYSRQNGDYEEVSKKEYLAQNTYYIDSESKVCYVRFVLIPYQLNLYNADTNASAGTYQFYGVAGSFYMPHYKKLLADYVFPLYKDESYTYKTETYTSTEYEVGGGDIQRNIKMAYRYSPPFSPGGAFGGFGRAGGDKYQFGYKPSPTSSTQYVNSAYYNVHATINFNAYLKPTWKKEVIKATCDDPEYIIYTKNDDSGEEYYVENGEPLGHNYVHNSSKDKPATVTKPLEEYWECTRCHDYEYRDGAKATTKEGKIGEFNYVFDNKNDAGVLTIDDVMPIEIPDCASPAAEIDDFSSLVKKIVFKSGKTTAIGDNAFAGLDNSAFTSVTLPANVTRIGYSSFADSKALKTVTFNGNNLETIGERAFFGTSLKEVTIPKSVTDIGSLAFGYEEKDGKITDVKGFKIKGYAGSAAEKYAKLNGFEFVDVEKSAPTKAPTAAPTKAPTAAPTKAPTSAPTAAPTKAPAGTTTPAATTAPGATTAPTTSPAADPQTTTAPDAPATVTSEGQTYTVNAADGTAAYSKPETSTDKVTIPDSITVDGHTYKVTAVNDNAFKGDKTITEVVIGKNVKTIGNNAFSGCTKLKKVTGAASVTKIGNNAFKNCKALTKITIGKKVKEIGKNAFSGCKKLATINVKTKVLKKVGKNAFKKIAPKAVFNLPKKKFAAEKKLIRDSKVAKTVVFKKA